MKPTVARIVHYTNLGDRDGRFPPETIAAIITRATPKPDTQASLSEEHLFDVSLRMFYPDGEFVMHKVPFTPHKAGSEEARGCWTWPARE